jgi:RNA polymerase sigma-70 factor (ECF subfamily)
MDYEKLYNSYYMQVYSYAVTLTKNPEQAEEITQHTFVKALSSKAGYKGKSSEITWLCSIAKNLYYDELRRNQKLTGVDDVTGTPSGDDMEKAVSDADAAFRIHLVLHNLEEPYKEVFQLRVFGELSFTQIASIFRKTESWARVTYHRARLKIKERME